MTTRVILESDNFTDESNSTSTPLDNGNTFTGEWVHRSLPEVLFSMAADQNCSFQFEFSTDRVNIDSTLGYTYTVGAINTPKRLVVARKFYRIVITNDSGSNMTYLRAQTGVGKFGPLANSAGAINTSDFNFEIAKGTISNHSISTKFGYNADIDTTSTPEDIWAGGGVYTGQPSQAAGAETVDVVSSSTADTSAGTGARTIKIIGLDSNWLEQSETITMNGTTEVTSSNTWHRVFSTQVLTAGSGGQNAGNITVKHTTTTANVFVVLPTNNNQSAIGCYTVPANKTMYIVRFRASIGRANGSAGEALYTLRVREPGGVFRGLRRETITTNYPADFTLKGAIIIPAMSDVKVRCESVSDNNTAFAVAFEYVLIC